MEIDSSYYGLWFEEFVKSLVNEKELVNEAYKVAIASYSEYGRGAVVYDCSLIFHKWLRSQLVKGENTEISVAYGLSSNSQEWLEEYDAPSRKTILDALNTYDPNNEFLLCVTSYANKDSRSYPKLLVFQIIQIANCKSSN